MQTTTYQARRRSKADYYTDRDGIGIFMLTITYMQAMTVHIHTQGRFNNHIVYILYKMPVLANSVMGVMKMGNIAPRMEIEPISLAFWSCLLTIIPNRFPDVFPPRKTKNESSLWILTIVPVLNTCHKRYPYLLA